MAVGSNCFVADALLPSASSFGRGSIFGKFLVKQGIAVRSIFVPDTVSLLSDGLFGWGRKGTRTKVALWLVRGISVARLTGHFPAGYSIMRAWFCHCAYRLFCRAWAASIS